MITAEQFEAAVGCPPEDDDLDRCNCTTSGHVGHWACGWNAARGMPHFVPGTAKNARYRLISFNNQDADRYEKVFLLSAGPVVRNHSNVLNAAGQELVIHNSEILNPFNRVLQHHHPHKE